jgi:hypothetical protein
MDKSRVIDDTIEVLSINEEGKFFEKGTIDSIIKEIYSFKDKGQI